MRLKRDFVTYFVVSFLLTGCLTTAKYTTSDSESIRISRPLVFPKESLVEDRLREQRWLEGQLEQSFDAGLQGKRFTRDFSVTTIGAKIQADPTVVGNYRAQQQFNAENIERLSQLAEQQHKTELEIEKGKTKGAKSRSEVYDNYIEKIGDQVDKQIEAAQQKSDEYEQIKNAVCGTEGPSGKGPTSEDCQKARKAYITALGVPSGLLPQNKTVGDVLNPTQADGTTPFYVKKTDEKGNTVFEPIFAKNSLDTPSGNPSDIDAFKGVDDLSKVARTIKDAVKVDKQDDDFSNGLNVSPIKEFEDRLSYRARVRDEIAKNRLDDRHDSLGNSLYRLQYQVTVVPKSKTPHWAKVEVELRPNATTLLPSEFFDSFSEKVFQENKAYKALVKAGGLKSGNENVRKQYLETLTKLHSDYVGTSNLLPRSVNSFTNDWRGYISKKFLNEFNLIHEKFEKKETITSEEDKFHLNTILDDICVIALFDKEFIRPYKKIFKENCLESIEERGVRFIEEGELKTALDNVRNELSAIRTASSNNTNEVMKKEVDREKILSAIESQKKNARISSVDILIDELKSQSNKENPDKKYLNFLKLLAYDISVMYAYASISEEIDFRQYVYISSTLHVNTDGIYNIQNPDQTLRLSWEKFELLDEEERSKEFQLSAAYHFGLWRLFSDLLSKQRADVYGVYPIEESQRIQDVAEVSRLLGGGVGLNFLAGNTGGKLALEYLQGKEKLFSNILRKPVLLGLPGNSIEAKGCEKGNGGEGKTSCDFGGVKFGWLIGPIYQIDDDRKDASFVQAETSKTVSVDISVPSWWKSMGMKVKKSWIHPETLVEEKINGDGVTLASVNNPIELSARELDVDKLFRSSARPVLRVSESPKKTIKVSAGKKLSMIIRGKDLWRVNEVTLGNMRTRNIDVIGDMNSILVKFPTIDRRACTFEFEIDNQQAKDAKKVEKCESKILLWSRSAEPIQYGEKVSVIFSGNPVETEEFDPDDLEVRSYPDGEIKTSLAEFNSSTNNKIIEYTLSKPEGFDESKISLWISEFDEIKLVGNKAVQSRENPRNVALRFEVSLKQLWEKNKKCVKADEGVKCNVTVSLWYNEGQDIKKKRFFVPKSKRQITVEIIKKGS